MLDGFSWDLLLTSAVALFFVIDPLGIMPIFASLTSDRTTLGRVSIALRAVLVAAGVLTGFALLGDAVLDRIGITMAAFQTAGGILLFIIGLEMVFELRNLRRSRFAERSVSESELSQVQGGQPDDIAIFPIGIPLLVGPGAIASIMLLMDAHEGQIGGQMAVFLALAIVLILSFLLMVLAGLISHWINESVTVVITRIMGMLVCALSVQFIFNGIKGTFGAVQIGML